MKTLTILLCGLAILLGVNAQVWRFEHAIDSGEPVLLRLAPVDPRSLMQGDYMRLNYEIARQWAQAHPLQPAGSSQLVIRLDNQGVAHWQPHGEVGKLAPDERLLNLVHREGSVKVGPNAYFFEEGQGEALAGAAYGEFRLQPDGSSLSLGLRDAQLRPLGETRGRW